MSDISESSHPSHRTGTHCCHPQQTCCCCLPILLAAGCLLLACLLRTALRGRKGQGGCGVCSSTFTASNTCRGDGVSSNPALGTLGLRALRFCCLREEAGKEKSGRGK